MPALAEGPVGDVVREGIVRGIYRYAEPTAPEGRPEAAPKGGRRVSLCFSGPMWQAAMEARELLAEQWGVSADAWSVTSWTELRTDAISAERWNRLHPGRPARTPVVTEALGTGGAPVIAVTDFMRAVPDQVSRWVARPFTSLGTDGFGRSDARQALRRYFEVDAAHVVVAALSALARAGEGDPAEVAEAIRRFGIDPDAGSPFEL